MNEPRKAVACGNPRLTEWFELTSLQLMATAKPCALGVSRRCTGLLALALLLTVNFQSTAVAFALWLAHHNHHGHEHQIVVQADGDHLNVRLTHPGTQPTTEPHHQSSLGLLAALFSTHDHDGDDHVLHFNLTEAPDHIRQRNIITAAPASAPPIAIAAINSFLPPLVSTKPTAVIPPESPPPLTAGRLGLRTTVLLI